MNLKLWKTIKRWWIKSWIKFNYPRWCFKHDEELSRWGCASCIQEHRQRQAEKLDRARREFYK